VRNEVLLGVKERIIQHIIKQKKAYWIGHLWRRNCLVTHFVEGKLEGRIKVMRRQRGRSKQLVDDVKEI
jgi:hypothetical protein